MFMNINKKIFKQNRKRVFNKLFLALLFLFSFNNQAKPMLSWFINKTPRPNALLIENVRVNNIRNVQKALNQSANINTRDIYGNAPLHLSVNNNNTEITIKLLEHPECNIESENYAKNRPLHVAAIKGSLECANILISHGIDINTQNNYLRTPLHIAVIKKNIEIIELLIHTGADTTIIDDQGKIPQSYANPNTKKIIKRIKKEISRQIRREKRQQRKERQQMYEEEQKIYTQNIIQIQSKLRSYLQHKRSNQEKKAIITTQSQLRKVLAQPAYKRLIHTNRMENDYQYRSDKIKKHFLKNLDELLLNINGPIKKLVTKKEILKEFKEILFMQSLSTRENFEEEKSFRHLVKRFRDNQGNTALHLFAMYGKQKFIPALILNGADINALNNNNKTPLLLATECNNFTTVQTLAYFGANANISSSEAIKAPPGIYPPFYTLSQTPLGVAIKMQNKEIVYLLKNIDLNFQTMPSKKTSLNIESDPYWIFDLNMYRNINPEIENKINGFIEWLQVNPDINFAIIKNKTKNNIFHYMAKYNHPQLIRLIEVFLELGVYINTRNKKGFTPLQIAVISGNTKMAQALVHYGAQIITL